MKLIYIALVLISFICTGEEVTKKGIKFLFPEHFSTIINVEIKIVKSPNTYYAANYIDEDYYIQVLKINGKKIKPSIPIELNAIKPEKYNVGETHNILVYERIKEIGEPTYKDYLNKVNLHYRNILQEAVEPIGSPRVSDWTNNPAPTPQIPPKDYDEPVNQKKKIKP